LSVRYSYALEVVGSVRGPGGTLTLGWSFLELLVFTTNGEEYSANDY
jgi:hypothetical protein